MGNNDDSQHKVASEAVSALSRSSATEREEADQGFRAIFDNHHVVMLLIDPETGRIEDGSPAACTFYGYSRDDLRKKSISEINTLTREQAAERLQLAKSRQQKYFDFQHRLASGEIRDVEVCTGPIVIDGKTLLFSVINDVTDRKRAEAALVESEEKYRNLFQNAPIGIFQSTPQGTVLNVNPTFAQIYGYESPEEVIDSVKDVAAQLYIEPEKRGQIVEKVLRNDRLLNFENEYRKKDGTVFTGNLHLQVVRNTDGSVSHLEGFVEDITERKNAEKALRESEEKFSKVFHNSPDAITLTDLTDNTLVDVNESYTRISGYSREESIGRTTVELGLNPDDRTKFITALRKQGRVLNFEAPFKTKSGHEIICSISGELIELGGKPYLLGVVRDRTERKRAEEALRKSEARVRMKLDSILSPTGDIGTLELADVFDAETIQALTDDFFSLTNIGVGIVDREGKVLVATGWQEICTKFHRAHPETYRYCVESDTELSGALEQGSFKLYRCKNNMWDIATPIIVGGKHLGNLFLGQFLFEDESPDYEVFRSRARQYGFDEEQYLAALDKVPRWSRQTVDTVMAFYTKLASILSTLGYSNIKLARSLAEQERLLNSLRESEQRYRAVIDNIEVGISLINSEMEIVDVNRAFKEYFPHVRPGSRQICYEQYNDPPRSGPCSYCPCVLTLSDGKVHEAITDTPTGSEIRHYHLVSSPIKDSHGRVQFVIELTEDITERKQAEERLRQAEHRYRRLFEDAPLMYVITRNEEGVPFISDCNEPFLRSLGYSREEVVGQPLANFYSPTSITDLLEGGGYARALAGDFLIGERQLLKRNGSLIPTLLYTAPEVGPSGQAIGTCAMFVDITERKKAEEALGSEREQLLSIFESINEVILVIDPATYEILYANKFTEDLYGKKLRGGNCYEKLNSLDSPCGHCAMDRATELQGKPYQWEYHNPVLKRDFLATDRMIRWSDGREVKFQIAVDVTERKLAEHEKENLRSQLLQAQKMEAVGTLAGGIAHDFNNLLQVASGYSELLLQQKDKDDAEYADLLKIFQAAKNGAELVHSLLTFSRKVEPRLIVLNLNTQIIQVDKLLRRTIPKMIAIRLDLSSDLADINADPTQMEQILMNLAINASDAMPNGGNLTISTRTATIDEEYCRYHAGAAPGEYVVLAVTDTGHGMDKDTVEHIFEPFYTTKEIGRGTGLGLAMVYGIVTQHGGHIVCDSEVGRGTTFNIYLPAVPAAAEPAVESSGEMPAFGTETVLLVDDEELIRELGGRILQRSGYTVLTAANGEEALRVYDRQKEQIALVILDLMMPTMGGKDCLKELLRINSQAKILIASGYSADASTKEILALGAKGFVAKPFKFKGLLQQVRKALDQN